MDINGTANSVHKIMLETFEQDRPWFDGDDWGRIDISHKTTKTTLKTEDEGKLDYGLNWGGMVVVTNEDSKNAWGVSRGVRAISNLGFVSKLRPNLLYSMLFTPALLTSILPISIASAL